MGYGDEFRIPVSDTQAYKQFGNSVAVPVFEEVARIMQPHIQTLVEPARKREAARGVADVHDAETRSRNMAAIKGSHKKPELLIRKALHAAGLRYRLQVQDLAGKPDLVYPRHRAVVIV